ncbi:MAG: hypothetical protein WBD74_09410 [Candidatus Aquilonibacter sp.]
MIRPAQITMLAAFAAAFSGCGGYSTSPSTTAPPTPTSSPSVEPSGEGGGTVGFTIPTPAPVACTPAPVAIAVGQSVNINCSAPDYIGPFTWSIANPAIASIEPNSQAFTYFSVTGRNTGTTMFLLQDQLGGSGSDTITVSP